MDLVYNFLVIKGVKKWWEMNYGNLSFSVCVCVCVLIEGEVCFYMVLMKVISIILKYSWVKLFMGDLKYFFNILIWYRNGVLKFRNKYIYYNL